MNPQLTIIVMLVAVCGFLTVRVNQLNTNAEFLLENAQHSSLYHNFLDNENFYYSECRQFAQMMGWFLETVYFDRRGDIICRVSNFQTVRLVKYGDVDKFLRENRPNLRIDLDGYI